jgi:hypothetical protein
MSEAAPSRRAENTAYSSPLGGLHPAHTIIAPVAANTRYFDAGPVRIGVEYRLITSDIVNANLQAANAEHGGEYDMVTVPEDGGVSLHVVDAVTHAEYLRFDMFDDSPHYHYIHPGEYQRNIPFDRTAFGDMFEWVQLGLRHRLRDMLAFCGATDVAARIDAAQVASVLPAVAAAVRAGTSR